MFDSPSDIWSCCWILLAIAHTSSALEIKKDCPRRNVAFFNDSYFIVRNSCSSSNNDGMGVSSREDCHQCDLLVHHVPCDEAKGVWDWDGTWCDRSVTCDYFQCTRHDYHSLRKFAEQCGDGGDEPNSECDDPVSSARREDDCGLALTGLGSAGQCVVSSNKKRETLLVSKFPRIPITRIHLDFFENVSTIDTSVSGPVYIRIHTGLPDDETRQHSRNRRSPRWLETINAFLRSCAFALLGKSKFLLLYLPRANAAVEFGHSDVNEDLADQAFDSAFIYMCTAQTPSTVLSDVRLALMLTGVSLSLLGLLLTAVASIVLGEHRNVPGFNLLSLVASLFVAYSTVPVAVLHKDQPPNICLIAAIFHIFTLLASVFWMNVVAFDIWQSLSTVQHLDQYRSCDHCPRLARYCIWAWGVPALLVVCGAILDRSPGVPRKFRPAFVRGCWFKQKSTLATILLYYGPIGLIMVANTIFFLLTARLVCQAQRQRLTATRVADAQRYRFTLYVKLFLVMGLTWVMESLTGPINSVYYELVSDFVNTLQGFGIFLIFGCKSRVWRRLQRCFGVGAGRMTGAASSFPTSSTFRSERDVSFKIANNTTTQQNSTTL